MGPVEPTYAQMHDSDAGIISAVFRPRHAGWQIIEGALGQADRTHRSSPLIGYCPMQPEPSTDERPGAGSMSSPDRSGHHQAQTATSEATQTGGTHDHRRTGFTVQQRASAGVG